MIWLRAWFSFQIFNCDFVFRGHASIDPLVHSPAGDLQSGRRPRLGESPAAILAPDHADVLGLNDIGDDFVGKALSCPPFAFSFPPSPLPLSLSELPLISVYSLIRIREEFFARTLVLDRYPGILDTPQGPELYFRCAQEKGFAASRDS